MITVALVILSLAAFGFVYRLCVGPTVADRVIALEGLLATVMCGVLAGAANDGTALAVDAVLVVALAGFVASAALGRYVEERGD